MINLLKYCVLSHETSCIWVLNVLKVVKSLARAEKVLKPEWKEMFYDVYYDMPDQLV